MQGNRQNGSERELFKNRIIIFRYDNNYKHTNRWWQVLSGKICPSPKSHVYTGLARGEEWL
jgi:hypothetical protein